jgi:hypothetical protein
MKKIEFLCVPDDKSGMPVFPLPVSSKMEAEKLVASEYPGGRLFIEAPKNTVHIVRHPDEMVDK